PLSRRCRARRSGRATRGALWARPVYPRWWIIAGGPPAGSAYARLIRGSFLAMPVPCQHTETWRTPDLPAHSAAVTELTKIIEGCWPSYPGESGQIWPILPRKPSRPSLSHTATDRAPLGRGHSARRLRATHPGGGGAGPAGLRQHGGLTHLAPARQLPVGAGPVRQGEACQPSAGCQSTGGGSDPRSMMFAYTLSSASLSGPTRPSGSPPK